MKSAKYDHEARLKSRDAFLAQVPESDEVFIAAARRAVISAGLGREILQVLHPEATEVELSRAEFSATKGP